MQRLIASALLALSAVACGSAVTEEPDGEGAARPEIQEACEAIRNAAHMQEYRDAMDAGIAASGLDPREFGRELRAACRADVAAVRDLPGAPEPQRTPAAASSVCGDGASLIVYQVEGTATSVDLTISNAQGNTEQGTGLNVPLQGRDADEPGFRLGCIPSGQFLYVSAQNRGSSGTVECRIEADGATISRASSSGAYVIASCDAVAP